MAAKLELSAKQVAMSINPLQPIGSFLDGAMDDVEKALNDAIGKAQDAASRVLQDAGEQAMRVIASLKGAYLDSLAVTYKDADQLIRENLDRVGDLVTLITSQEQSALDEVATKVQDIIRLSPLSHYWIPLLSNTTPKFFAVDADPMDSTKKWTTKVLITFVGNFYYSAQADYAPSFAINGKLFAPVVTTSNQLGFVVDIDSDDPKLNLRNYSYLSASLSVAWKEGGLFSFLKPKKVSTYRTLLGVLPASPGVIKVTYTTPATTIQKTVNEPEVQITRDTDHWETHTGQVKADAGWHIVPGSARLIWTQGPYSQCNGGITNVDQDTVYFSWSFKNGSGTYKIVFDEYEPVAATTRTETYDSLKWASSFIATPQAGESITQIDFDAFSGEHVAFQPRTDETNPYISLREFNGTIQVTAKKSSDLKDGVTFTASTAAKALKVPAPVSSFSSLSTKLVSIKDKEDSKAAKALKVPASLSSSSSLSTSTKYRDDLKKD